jgi:tetratricopeptide (TPR) repeat protein
MPRLSPIQWVIFFAFLVFYGFAVFAVTRDYYLRNPPQPAVAEASSGAAPAQGQRTWIQGAMQQDASSIPPALTQSNPVLLMKQADALFSQQRYGEVIPIYRRVIELDPKIAEAYNDLGLALFYTGQSPAAVGILKQGTATQPDFQRIWLTLGFVTLQSGDKEAAKPALEKARALGPDNAIGREADRMLGMLAN